MSKLLTIATIFLFLFSCTKSNHNEALQGIWNFSFYVNTQKGYSEQSNGVITFSDPKTGNYKDVTNGIQANFNWSLYDSNLLITFDNGSEYRFRHAYTSDLKNVFIQEENQERDSLILIRSHLLP